MYLDIVGGCKDLKTDSKQVQQEKRGAITNKSLNTEEKTKGLTTNDREDLAILGDKKPLKLEENTIQYHSG
jgi:hypothetical protein